MKKGVRRLICLVLALLVILAFPLSTSALSDSMTHTYDGGTLRYVDNRYYTYSSDTAACKTSASATLTFERGATLYAKIEICLLVQNEYCLNHEKDNLAQGNEVTVTISNICDCDGVNNVGEITSAIGRYRIGSLISFDSSVS